MTEALLSVISAGPHVSVQDGGRPGLMRFGVPQSGPMDRMAFAAANIALGNPPDAPGIEVSLGGLTLECLSGEVGFAVAGGGFRIDHAGRRRSSWTVATLRAGEVLVMRPGQWGSWCYLALAGNLLTPIWLGSHATHALSGFGGGRLPAGQRLEIAEARGATAGDIPCPVFARPRRCVHVTLGPQDRFFSAGALETFLSISWRMTDAWDRMGVRLSGPAIAPSAALDMPSEPITRGAVQVAGDGVPTVLLADHQTTGGYPKIATVLDCDLDAFVQLRPHDEVKFQYVAPEQAVLRARAAAARAALYRQGIERRAAAAALSP
ncbi:5-oxoprolinase subunit C family protein [Haematobacter genomosp. 1]|uniref:Allophanate hydrolase n=1 Tax=Haematobacter genomosp. 1 TaxID=366618 RepID=A0A212ADT8_9RHOB|nr:biotin-dependent carboxyltransferase family protein [Haematobacter genomosp. 1]OWJ79408.1 allophanate hydrolase [Haematobacter genomosp. 1]